MNELNAGLFSKLSSGTALTALLGGTAIYHLQAPKDTPLPFVLFSWQAGGLTADHDIFGGLEWVRAYGTSAKQAGSIYAQFDGLLHGGSITVTGYTNIGLRREDYREYPENLPNTETSYVCGAFYRIYLDK